MHLSTTVVQVHLCPAIQVLLEPQLAHYPIGQALLLEPQLAHYPIQQAPLLEPLLAHYCPAPSFQYLDEHGILKIAQTMQSHGSAYYHLWCTHIWSGVKALRMVPIFQTNAYPPSPAVPANNQHAQSPWYQWMVSHCQITLVDPVSLNDVLLPEAWTENVTFCDCSPLPVELIRLGFFPAAPCRPKIAYHLNALLFASNLFLRISPNITAWCAAWLACLQHKGVEFGSKVGLTLVCCLNDRLQQCCF